MPENISDQFLFFASITAVLSGWLSVLLGRVPERRIGLAAVLFPVSIVIPVVIAGIIVLAGLFGQHGWNGIRAGIDDLGGMLAFLAETGIELGVIAIFLNPIIYLLSVKKARQKFNSDKHDEVKALAVEGTKKVHSWLVPSTIFICLLFAALFFAATPERKGVVMSKKKDVRAASLETQSLMAGLKTSAEATNRKAPIAVDDATILLGQKAEGLKLISFFKLNIPKASFSIDRQNYFEIELLTKRCSLVHLHKGYEGGVVSVFNYVDLNNEPLMEFIIDQKACSNIERKKKRLEAVEEALRTSQPPK